MVVAIEKICTGSTEAAARIRPRRLQNRQRFAGIIEKIVRPLMAVILGLLPLFAACQREEGVEAKPALPFAVPANPHLSDSPWPISHLNAYAQASSSLPGALGTGSVAVREIELGGLSIIFVFNSRGHLFTIPKGVNVTSTIYKVDPIGMTVLDSLEIPTTGVRGGVYCLADSRDRIVASVGGKLMWFSDRDETTGSEADLHLVGEVDLSSHLSTGDEIMGISILYTGELVFATTGTDDDPCSIGVVAGGFEAPDIRTIDFPGETMSNSVAVDEDGGIYLVTSHNARRVTWTGSELVDSWACPYEPGERRPMRLGLGSGSTPSLMLDRYVAITDNAPQMNLLVLRRGLDVADDDRLVDIIPTLEEDSTSEQSVLVCDRSMIVAQNVPGKAGLERYDLSEAEELTLVWHNPIELPSCIPSMSRDTRQVYVYGMDGDQWTMFGIDFDSGETLWRAHAGEGFPYNNYYSGVVVGPQGRLYIGIMKGLVSFADE